MRRSLTRTIGAAAIVLAVVLVPAVASAHPLGNYTVNVYSGLQFTPGQVHVDYVLDEAEIPTLEEQAAIDVNGDGTYSDSEMSGWAARTSRVLLGNVELSVGGEQVSLRVASSTARFRPGQAGLNILRLEATFEGILGKSGSFAYRDGNYADVRGWHEITAVGQDGVVLQGSDVPTRSVSNALLAYPADLLSSPLQVTQASATFEPGLSTDGPATTGATSDARPQVEGGFFAGLVDNRGIGLIGLAVLAAVVAGAWHAMLPGHGKTLMAGYLVAQGGRLRQAVAIGCAVAVMHTASVLGLGVVILILERTFNPVGLYPWLRVVSGLVAIGLGAALLVSRMGAWANAKRDEEHHHEHEAGLVHDHGDGHGHSHDLPDDVPVLSGRGLMALAVAGGILPSPTAVIVLLGAVSLHRVVFGLVLIAAFSAGLAVALIGAGVFAIRAREMVARKMSTFWGRLIPVLSAGAILAVGLFLAVTGFAQV